MTSNSTTIPLVFNTIIGNGTWMSDFVRVEHPDLGIDGVSIHGCQPFADVTTDGSTSNALVASTLATQLNANQILISPDTFNGPLAAKANLYDCYVFRDLLFEFVRLCPSTQVGGAAMALAQDGNNTEAPNTFSLTRQVVPNVAFPFFTEKVYLHYHFDGPKLWYNLIDTTNTATKRQTAQGTFAFYPSASSIGAVSQGFINVYYVCELFNPVASQGFTISVRRDERDWLRELLPLLREMDEEDQKSALARFRTLVKPVVALKK